MFSSILFTANCDVSFKIFRGKLCVFLTSNTKSIKDNVTCLISFLGVDLLNLYKKKRIYQSDEMFSEKKNDISIWITSVK